MARAPRKTGKKRVPPGVFDKKTEEICFSPEAMAETDPEWRAWFCQVERIRHERADPARRPLVFSPVDKDGAAALVVRRKGEPSPLAGLLKREMTQSGRRISPDREKLEIVWATTVGPDIAASTSVFALKNGVLTITVANAPLLQEIRQFHQHAIFKDILEAWTFAMPLVRIVYKLGR